MTARFLLWILYYLQERAAAGEAEVIRATVLEGSLYLPHGLVDRHKAAVMSSLSNL